MMVLIPFIGKQLIDFGRTKISYNMEKIMNNYKNKIGLILLFVVTLVFVISSSGFAEYYKYTDENGKTGYTDDMSKVPADQREDLQTYESSTSVQKKTTSIEYKDEVLYYDKETDYKIIQRDGFLLGITKNEEGLAIYTEMDRYPENLPPPGTHIDEE